MIVRDRPNAFKLLFALQGSILPQILPQLIIVIGLSAIVGFIDTYTSYELPNLPIAAFSLIGLTLSIFLGFRNNACYERWWEARKLWGHLITQIRHLDRDTSLLPAQSRQQVLYLTLAFSHALHAKLRQLEFPQHILKWVAPLNHAGLLTHRNPAQFLLAQIQLDLVAALKQGEISDICYAQINNHVIELGNVQAACERLLTTPLPFAYSLLLHRTAYFFCLLLPFSLGSTLGLLTPLVVGLLAYTFFGLDALGNELEEPFGLLQNDLPLDAMLRIIEIDLMQTLEPENVPPALLPVNQVLT